jgi:hypothetical protein
MPHAAGVAPAQQVVGKEGDIGAHPIGRKARVERHVGLGLARGGGGAGCCVAACPITSAHSSSSARSGMASASAASGSRKSGFWAGFAWVNVARKRQESGGY